jgi:hypothetical protein
MKKITKIAVLFMGLMLFSCSSEEQYTNENNENSVFARPAGNSPTVKTWEFNDLNEWQDASLDGIANYYLENGNVKMFTNANTWERTKIKSTSTYGAGTYMLRKWELEICPALGHSFTKMIPMSWISKLATEVRASDKV